MRGDGGEADPGGLEHMSSSGVDCAESGLDVPLSFSIVIPARNEEKDIEETLRCCLRLKYPPHEIIVVDDSTDATPQIVGRFSGQGVRLIHRESNENGCCGARRVGMRAATGTIVVLLNADDRPEPDFLDRLAKHYHRGADSVVVRSVVLNRDQWIPGYIWCQERDAHQREPDPLWSEGFSARRECFERVGWVPGDFPVKFCRDLLISKQLTDAGFRKVIDLGIEMPHVAPSTLTEYWGNQKWRGSFSAPTMHYLRGYTKSAILVREVLKVARGGLRVLTIVPLAFKAARYARAGRRSVLTIPGFTVLAMLQELAMRVGGILGLWRTLVAEGGKG